MDKNFIGERISELRLKKNVSEYQMSLDLGKNKSYIQSLTSGRSLPTMQSFLDICDYLEVTPQQFFDSELHNLPLIDFRSCQIKAAFIFIIFSRNFSILKKSLLFLN